MSLVCDSVPAGYFSVFKESADIIVTLIRAGCNIGPKFVPDISIGSVWAQYWKNEDLDQTLGVRLLRRLEATAADLHAGDHATGSLCAFAAIG